MAGKVIVRQEFIDNLKVFELTTDDSGQKDTAKQKSGLIISPDASIINQDSVHRFVTDSEKSSWNAKANGSDTYSKEETDTRIHNLVGAAPAALDTLVELASALNNDADFAATMVTVLSGKVDKVSGKGLSTNDFDNTYKAKVDASATTTALGLKVDKVTGMGLSANDFNSTYKSKLDSVSDNATKVEESINNGEIKINGVDTIVYTHPASHSPGIITQDASNRFVTDIQIASWGGKADASSVYTKSQTYTKTETDQRIQDVVGAAPAALDTLIELASALNNDASFASTITTSLSNKVDKVAGKELSANDFTSAYKVKLEGISANANKVASSLTNGNIKIDDAETTVYTHPSSHTASMITQDTSNRFVTDIQISSWNSKADASATTTALSNKVDKITGKGLSTNDFDNTYKTKVEGISTGANKTEASSTNGNIKIDGAETTVYTHPANHAPAIITQDASNRFVTDIQISSWNAKADDAAMTTALGLKVDKIAGKALSTNDFDATYKAKLDGIAAGATNYTHPANHAPSIISQDTNNRFVSDAEKTAWNAKADSSSVYDKTQTYNKTETDTRIQAVIGSAPAALDTLVELATALGNDASFASTITTSLSNKVDKISGKGLSTNDFDATAKSKLDGISAGANKITSSSTNGNIKVDGSETTVYVHPANHAASVITQDASNRFVTDIQITAWNAKADDAATTTALGLKVDKVSGKGLSTNDFDATYKLKLDGISLAANKTASSSTNGNIKIDGVETTVYTHPVNHAASVITQDASNRFVSDTEKSTWNAKLAASSYTAADVLAKLLTVDGISSLLDSDMVDGKNVDDTKTDATALWTAQKIMAYIATTLTTTKFRTY